MRNDEDLDQIQRTKDQGSNLKNLEFSSQDLELWNPDSEIKIWCLHARI